MVNGFTATLAALYTVSQVCLRDGVVQAILATLSASMGIAVHCIQGLSEGTTSP